MPDEVNKGLQSLKWDVIGAETEFKLSEKCLESITSHQINDLRKKVEKVLLPLKDSRKFVTYFYCNESQLFLSLLRSQLNKRSKTILDLQAALTEIKKTFDDMVLERDVKYRHLMPLKRLSKANRTKEIKILENFCEYSTSSISHLYQFDEVLALTQHEDFIKAFIELCETYNLRSCIDDEKFKKLKRILESLADKDALDLEKASGYMKDVREMFATDQVITDDERKPYFELIAELSKGIKYYAFLKNKGFLRKPGLFQDQLNLVTTSLQQEEYGSEILNHLTPAFNVVYRLDQDIPFSDLVAHIFELKDPDQTKRHLQRVNNNLESIERWFSGIDVSVSTF